MDKQTLKLLVGMPPKMLAAWEAEHPEKWSISHIARNYVLQEGFLLILCLAFILIAIAAILIGPTTPLKEGEALVVFGGVILFFAGASPIGLLIYHLWKWDAILEPLEAAVKDSTLDLMSCLKAGYGLKQIREISRARLVSDAYNVRLAEGNFVRQRLDLQVTEMELNSFLLGLLQFKAKFDATLSRAVEFGLSDGERRQYFIEVGRRIAVPPEGMSEY